MTMQFVIQATLWLLVIGGDVLIYRLRNKRR